LTALTAAGVLAVTGHDLGACLLFYRNYTSGGWHTTHFWSLAVEEHFYLAFPALLVLAGPRRCTAAVLGLAVTVVACRSADARSNLLSGVPGWPGQYFRTACRIDELRLGCATALLADRFPQRLGGRWARAAGLAGLALLLAKAAGQPVPGLALA